MTIKQRLIKLESSLPVNPSVVRIIRTIVDCSGKTPIGYSYEGIDIFKRHDESEDDCKGRLWDAIPAGDIKRHIFYPIYADNDNVII